LISSCVAQGEGIASATTQLPRSPRCSIDGVKGRSRFTRAESTAIRTALGALRRVEAPAQKPIRRSLRQVGFFISDWPRAITGFTRSDFDDLVRTGRIRIIG
jgi:hypothetical protein